jgi:hypothetical protein
MKAAIKDLDRNDQHKPRRWEILVAYFRIYSAAVIYITIRHSRLISFFLPIFGDLQGIYPPERQASLRLGLNTYSLCVELIFRDSDQAVQQHTDNCEERTSRGMQMGYDEWDAPWSNEHATKTYTYVRNLFKKYRNKDEVPR